MRTRLSPLSITWPFLEVVREYLLKHPVVDVVTYSRGKQPIETSHMKATITAIDIERIEVTLILEDSTKLILVRGKKKFWHKAGESMKARGNYDICTRRAESEIVERVAPILPHADEIASMIAIVYEEMQNAHGNLSLQMIDEPTLLKTERTARYLLSLIALTRALLKGTAVQVAINEHLHGFSDIIENERLRQP
jgi:hypothetical protein